MRKIVVIVGPTASGKTRLAIELAQALGGEVVSADSQQVYVGMDIGTGKATETERSGIPHHLIDVVRPDEEMTAARFAALADAAIEDIAARDRAVIVCGGTMLYVRILLYGLFESPPADAELRAELATQENLHARLAEVDPEAAAKIDPTDQRRIIRALEVFELTGVPISEHQRHHAFKDRKYEARVVGLTAPREELYARIDARVDRMMDRGLLAEVEALRAQGYRPPLRSQQAIGYAELHAHLDGALDLPSAVALIQRNSRRYARRQLSWYRSDASVDWSPVDLASLGRYLGRP